MNIRIALFLILTFLVFNLSISFVIAEEDAVQENEDVKQDTDENPPPKISSKKRSEVKTLKEFIPSEEVSADNPISFPTDI